MESYFNIGSFKAETKNNYLIELIVDEECDVFCNSPSITIYPEHLQKGINKITVEIEEIRNEVIIYAKLIITGREEKEIIINGIALDNADIHNEKFLLIGDEQKNDSNNNVYVDALPPDVKENRLDILKKGQRMIIGNTVSELKIQLAFDKKKPLDIDGYVFLLDDYGKVNKDTNLVYWGNKTSEDGAVLLSYTDSNSYFLIKPNKISDEIKRISVCYSIYGKDITETFRYVIRPYIRIITNGIEEKRYYISELQDEKTIVAVEIFLYEGLWRLSCVGSGYRNGLKRLCEEYGLEVDD